MPFPPRQQLQQQQGREGSLSRSHSSFYEEADPFYHQTMPPQPPAPQEAGGGEQSVLDPYGFPTPPRPGSSSKGGPASSPTPQQWPGTPF